MTSPIDAVGPQATLPADYDPSRAKVNASGTGKKTEMFDSEAFLKLLVAQLKYQDPTNPTDTSNFMNQTAMLSQVQTMNSMSDTLGDLMVAQQTASATNMIGKAISFVDPAGKQVTGLVDGVSFHQGAAMLHVGELAVPLAGVLVVADPSVMGNPPAGGGTGTDGGADGAGAVDGAGDADAAGNAAGTGSADGSAAENDVSTGDAPPESAEPPAQTAPTDSAPITRPDTISA